MDHPAGAGAVHVLIVIEERRAIVGKPLDRINQVLTNNIFEK